MRGHSAFSVLQKKQNVPINQRGFILLSVVVAITLVAALAFVLNYQGASETNIASGELQRDQLRYIAEAGMAHAKLQLAKNTSCSGYSDIPKTNFAGDSYSAAFSSNKDSPVTVKATGLMQNGAEVTLQSDAVRAYQSPNVVTLQLSKDDGKDVHIDSFYDMSNYGSVDDLTVRSSASWQQRPLLEFDLSAVPAGVRIISATLDLELRTVSVPGVIGVHRITRSWEEGTGKGTGNSDGASWLEYDGDNTWSQPGGDVDVTLYGTAAVSSAKNGQRVAWDISDLVDDWVSGQFPNFGLALVGDGVVDNAEFQSREEPDPAAAPRLTIVYACECGKTCAGAPVAGKNVLLVVGDTGDLTTEQADKKALMEGWGHTVSLIATSASQAEFDNEAGKVDVVYVPELGSGPMGELDTKADDLTTGVITEEARRALLLGSWSLLPFVDADSINIVDNTHYITETLPIGNVQLSTAVQSMWVLKGTLAVDLHVLGELGGTQPGLAYLEKGGLRNDSTPAPARRVKLPWGSYNFDVNLFTDDALDIMRRAIEWGASAPPAQLAGHWKLDDGAGITATDSSGRGNDGTLAGGPDWTGGQLAGALALDDLTNDRVVIPDDPSLDITDAITLAAWIKPNELGSQFIISKALFGVTDGYELSLSNVGKVFFRLNQQSQANTYRIQSTSIHPIDGNTWMHIAASYDGETQRLYINGVEENSQPASISINANNIDLGLGGQADGTRVLDGVLDDVRIYRGALDAAAIAELAATTGPVAHWKLDDGTGLTAIDSVGSNDGTLLMGPTWVVGQIGDALNFPSNSDYVNVPHNDALSLTDMTISLWLKATALNNVYQALLRKKQQANYQLATVDNEIWFEFNDGMGMTQFKATAAGLTTNQWYHVAVTLDDTTGDVNIYVDGAVKFSDTTTRHPLPNTEPLTIGGVAGSLAPWPGMLDDIRLYNYALSATEISDLFTAGSGGGGGGSCNGNYLDQFEVYQFDNSDGTLDWSTSPWQEIGESDGPTAGDIRIWSDLDSVRIRTRDNDNGGEGIEREADLSGAATATLSYDYRRDRLDSSSDYTTVEVSANGAAGPWTELARYAGPNNDDAYTTVSHDIGAFIANNTRIRFKTSSSMGNLDHIWFDNIQIACTP